MADKPTHDVVSVTYKGAKVTARCSCGYESPVKASETDARKAVATHAKRVK